MASTTEPTPELDLVFERTIDIPPEQVWAAWTTPEYLKKWFCPLPWKTVECEIDLRPGGIFSTVMQSPDGKSFPGVGCYLEVIKNRKLVWTNALAPGFRPLDSRTKAIEGESSTDFVFTAVISLEPAGTGTKYTATVIHGNAEDCKKHKNMGFHEGWGLALDQLITLAKSL